MPVKNNSINPNLCTSKYDFSKKFPFLTIEQKGLLFWFIEMSKKESWKGIFNWCIESSDKTKIPLGLLTGIFPGDSQGHFDRDHPLFRNKNWNTIFEKASLTALENFGYIFINPIPEVIPISGSNGESKWLQISISQLSFQLYSYSRRNLLCRFLIYYWEECESHIISVIFGMVGAILIEIIKIFFQGVR